jgi:hypothetical protein
LYARSVLGSDLHIIALCEVANIPDADATVAVPRRTRSGNHVNQVETTGHLRDHGWAHTLTMEAACVVRFMMVGGQFNVDVIAHPPSRVPTLRDVLEFQANRSTR